MPRDTQLAAALNWQEVRLSGNSAHEYAEQIEELGATLDYGWQTQPSPKTGNPVYVRPSVLVIYREDHKFLLDAVIPKPGRIFENYDLVLASQPWRARMSAEFKARRYWRHSRAAWRRADGCSPSSRPARIRAWRSFRSCGRERTRSRSIATSCSRR